MVCRRCFLFIEQRWQKPFLLHFSQRKLSVLAPWVWVLESLDGSSYPCHAPGEGTSPSLTIIEQTPKHPWLTRVQGYTYTLQAGHMQPLLFQVSALQPG